MSKPSKVQPHAQRPRSIPTTISNQPSLNFAVTGSRKHPLRRRLPPRNTRRPTRYELDEFDDLAVKSEQDQAHSFTATTPTADQTLIAFEDPNAQYHSTDSEAEENARIERSMGVIRKNAASRGSDGGTKYHCDVCSIDITSTVRISCANPACKEYDLWLSR
jgi:hypothetical protein